MKRLAASATLAAVLTVAGAGAASAAGSAAPATPAHGDTSACDADKAKLAGDVLDLVWPLLAVAPAASGVTPAYGGNLIGSAAGASGAATDSASDSASDSATGMTGLAGSVSRIQADRQHLVAGKCLPGGH